MANFAEEIEPSSKIESILTKKQVHQEARTDNGVESLDMLASLVDLQKNIKQQITVTSKKLKTSRQRIQQIATRLARAKAP